MFPSLHGQPPHEPKPMLGTVAPQPSTGVTMSPRHDAAPYALGVYLSTIQLTHCNGCCLHLLLEDGNAEDRDIECCLDRARERGHRHCEAAARALLGMTKAERLEATGVEDAEHDRDVQRLVAEIRGEPAPEWVRELDAIDAEFAQPGDAATEE